MFHIYHHIRAERIQHDVNYSIIQVSEGVNGGSSESLHHTMSNISSDGAGFHVVLGFHFLFPFPMSFFVHVLLVVNCTMPKLMNGNADKTMVSYLQSVNYTCNTGYRMNGSATAMCSADGTLQMPTCNSKYTFHSRQSYGTKYIENQHNFENRLFQKILSTRTKQSRPNEA